MSDRRTQFNAMDLAEARRIGLRPQVYRSERWPRALSILMRWASEPCRNRDYERRIEMCRKVYRLMQKSEAMRSWRDSRWKLDKELMKSSFIANIRGWSPKDRLVNPYRTHHRGNPSGYQKAKPRSLAM